MALAAEKLCYNRGGTNYAINTYTAFADVQCAIKALCLKNASGDFRYTPIGITTDPRAGYLRVGIGSTAYAVENTATISWARQLINCSIPSYNNTSQPIARMYCSSVTNPVVSYFIIDFSAGYNIRFDWNVTISSSPQAARFYVVDPIDSVIIDTGWKTSTSGGASFTNDCTDSITQCYRICVLTCRYSTTDGYTTWYWHPAFNFQVYTHG